MMHLPLFTERMKILHSVERLNWVTGESNFPNFHKIQNSIIKLHFSFIFSYSIVYIYCAGGEESGITLEKSSLRHDIIGPTFIEDDVSANDLVAWWMDCFYRRLYLARLLIFRIVFFFTFSTGGITSPTMALPLAVDPRLLFKLGMDLFLLGGGTEPPNMPPPPQVDARRP